jgi:hypothetical protein
MQNYEAHEIKKNGRIEWSTYIADGSADKQTYIFIRKALRQGCPPFSFGGPHWLLQVQLKGRI